MLFNRTKPSANGHSDRFRRPLQGFPFGTGGQDSEKAMSRASASGGRFTAESLTGRRGIPIRFPANSLSLGIGSTAGRVVQLIADKLVRECGRLPGAASYLIVDAAEPPYDLDLDHFVSIGRTGDGVGTLPENGLKAFDDDADRIRDAISCHLESLFYVDPRYVPVKPAIELTHVNLVAGCGGTSGGALIPSLEMVTNSLQTRGVRKIRINVTMIGPDIVTRDISRRQSMDDRAVAIIYETFAMNYEYLHHLTCQDRSSVSLQVVDQSNLRHVYSQNLSLERMVAEALFLRWYTAAGVEVNARQCDQDQIDQRDGRGASPKT